MPVQKNKQTKKQEGGYIWISHKAIEAMVSDGIDIFLNFGSLAYTESMFCSALDNMP